MTDGTLKYRIGEIEQHFKKDGVVFKLDEKVEKIMENHLPHIKSDLSRLTWLAGLNLLAIIGGALVLKFL